MSRIRTRAIISIGLTTLAALAVGCGQPPGRFSPPEKGREIESLESVMSHIREHPEAFLRESLVEAAKLATYSAQFERQERLGPLNTLRPTEHILAEYRDHPFSVRFTWQDADSEYLQCYYVQDLNDNKVVLLPRHGLFGLPPAEQKFDPKLSVTFGKSRNPITDFGPRRTLERTLDRIEKAKAKGEVKFTVRLPTEIGPAKELCFHLEIRYPEGDDFRCKLQDVYLNTQTHLPVATWLWLPGQPERSEETLDASYVFGHVDPTAWISDATFVIDAAANPPKTAKAVKKHRPTAKAEAEAAGGGSEPATSPPPSSPPSTSKPADQ